VIDSAAARVDSEADPTVAGAIHASLANVYLGRGLPERAEHHARRALALTDEGSVRAALAHNALAQALADSGRPADAEPHHETALRVLRAADAESELAVALNTYGTTLFALDRPDEAEAAYREALDLKRRLGDPDVATVLNNLAVLVTQQGRNEEGAALLGEMVADLRRREGAAAAYQRSFSLMNWAGALSNLGRADSALAAYREGVASFVETLGEDHPETIAARTSLAFHLHRMGRYDEAQQVGAVALAAAETALGEGHPYTAYAQNVAGTAYCDGGDPQRGAPLLRASTDARRAMLPEGHWLVANGESLLGGCLLRLDRRPEAERLLRSSYAALRTALGDDHLKTAEARERLRALDAEPDRPSEATPRSESE
jgi:serine/threonine-protein kinase